MTIKKGDTVKVDYTGTFDDGTVFDSSTHGDHSHPLEFVVGAGQVISGFDNAVIGMKKGDEKKIRIEPKDGYGSRNEKLIQKVPRAAVPAEAKEGMLMRAQSPAGEVMIVKILKMDAKNATLDFNHPMAGKTLNFKIKVVDVVSK